MNAKYDSRLSPMTRLIYNNLLSRTCHGSRPTKIEDNELALLFNLTDRSVSRSINLLCKYGYLRKVKLLNKRLLYIDF